MKGNTGLQASFHVLEKFRRSDRSYPGSGCWMGHAVGLRVTFMASAGWDGTAGGGCGRCAGLVFVLKPL